MNRKARFLAAGLTATCLSATAAAQSPATADFCPMGGTMIKAECVKDKALAWAAAPRTADINDAGADGWTVMTRSGTDRGIAIMVTPGYVFFGVAGRGGEVYPQNIEQAFGRDFGRLREAIRKDLADLVQAGVVRIDAAETPRLAGLAGLGFLEKGADGWALKTQSCQPVDLPASGL